MKFFNIIILVALVVLTQACGQNSLKKSASKNAGKIIGTID